MATVTVYKMVKVEVEVDEHTLATVSKRHWEIQSMKEHQEWLAAGDKIAEMAGSQWATPDNCKYRRADGTVEEMGYRYGDGVMAVVDDEGYILTAL